MPTTPTLRTLLAEGRHAHSKGRVLEVAEMVRARPRLLSSLIELLWDDDEGVAMRAADVLERVTHEPAPALGRAFQRWKDALLGLLAEATLNKVRWNLALTVPRLALTLAETRRAAQLLQSYLKDESSIVKTAALQGLADLALQDAALLPVVLDLLRVQGRSGTPAMRARSRHLLKRLEKTGRESRRIDGRNLDRP